MIRSIKILLTLAVGLWGVMGGLANLASYADGIANVASVMSLETLPEEASNGPVTPSPIMVTLGFAFIWLPKLIGGALSLFGTFLMWKNRRESADSFRTAKRWAIAGCGTIFFMLFLGFSLVAVGPYKLYLSPLIGAVELAAMFAAQIGLVMVFLHQED